MVVGDLHQRTAGLFIYVYSFYFLYFIEWNEGQAGCGDRFLCFLLMLGALVPVQFGLY
jgi:hypothetical protein